MNAPIPINHFDRGKPFYPLVINYVVQLIGFKEIALRGAIGTQYPSTEEMVQKIEGLMEVSIQNKKSLELKK